MLGSTLHEKLKIQSKIYPIESYFQAILHLYSATWADNMYDPCPLLKELNIDIFNMARQYPRESNFRVGILKFSIHLQPLGDFIL